VHGPRLENVANELRKKPGVDQVAPFGATLHVVGSDEKALKAALADVEKEHKGVTVEPGETSLEDVFIQFMSGSKDNMG
jgi:ABC-2 type transport system ATP-binding protein